MALLRKRVLNLVYLVLISLLLWFVFCYYQFCHKPLILKSPSPAGVSTIRVPPGTGTNNLVNHFVCRGLVKHKSLAKLYAALYTWRRPLKAGEYQIRPGLSLAELLAILIDGDVYVRQFVITEGWRYQDLLHELRVNQTLKHVLVKLSDRELLNVFGARYRHPEGQFFPDTYFYTWGDSDFDLLQQAYAKMKRVLAHAWMGRAANLPYKTPYQALIVASLIEKETAIDKERHLIASVIVNRLNRGWPLQIDPTVIYGLDLPSHYRLARSDLRRFTPYNTYLVKGLPPTPIALPGMASINAALHPAHTDYFFYVASGNGGHKFSQNYQQHLKAVKKYLHNHQENAKDTETEEQAKWLFSFFHQK